MWKRLAVCVFALVVAACADINQVGPSAGLEPGGSNGLVIVSATYSGRVQMVEMSYWYAPKGAALKGIALDKRIWFTVGRLKADPDRIAIDADNTFGEVAVLSLPEGEYEFFSFAGATLGVVHRPKQPFSMPFTVTRGRVTYIGNLNVAFSQVGTFRVEIRDTRDRDVPPVLAKYRRLKQEQLDYRLMTMASP
jgi:hypothetical protein